jgi:hypothetical protein
LNLAKVDKGHNQSQRPTAFALFVPFDVNLKVSEPEDETNVAGYAERNATGICFDLGGRSP